LLKKSKIKSYLVLLVILMLVFAPLATAQETAPEKIIDNELVVAQLDDNGQISSIQVLNHVRVFGEGKFSIQDSSRFKLASVRNLYGNEKITTDENNNLTLPFNIKSGNTFGDIYYLASIADDEVANMELPVSISLEYYLDGQKVLTSELAGKSGHLKIVTTMENLTGKPTVLQFKDINGEEISQETIVYTPYAVALKDWAFDNDKFANISAPGVAEESPEGTIANIQGVTTVSWTVPLIPPSYPAKQYATFEADAVDIELPSFNIAVMSVVPVQSSIDNLGKVQNSLEQLYGGFDQIQGGIGAPNQDATLLYGLNAVNGGLGQISGGLGSLYENLMKIRVGMSTPGFDAASYDSAKGADAAGKTPGVQDAIKIMKNTIDSQLIPGLMIQKATLTTMENSVGKPADSGQEPSSSTSIYNDINQLKAATAGTPAQKIITDSIEPKLKTLGNSIADFRDGSNYPASVAKVEAGSKQLSEALGKADQGLAMMVFGLGALEADGKPMPIMLNGKPGSVLYALVYLQNAINGQLKPGVSQLSDGASQIGTGAGTAKEGIAEGLQTFQSIPVLTSTLKDNASQASNFLGKIEGAETTLAYVFQTQPVTQDGKAMKYGLGAIGVSLIALIAAGRPPKLDVSTPVDA
jgi:X-X-X-Leu-X-X-Gly heptad repeat protein